MRLKAAFFHAKAREQIYCAAIKCQKKKEGIIVKKTTAPVTCNYRAFFPARGFFMLP
jgi:hypothetical protein